MVTFQELISTRRQLQQFCLQHVPSLVSFEYGHSFRLYSGELDWTDKDKLRHLTNTGTCIESLLDCPERFQTEDISERAGRYAHEAIKRPPKDWKSEGSAKIYCRCRALPVIVDQLTDFHPSLPGHLNVILGQLRTKNRFAVGEAGPGKDTSSWYPPNAFHTYWTLELLERLRRFDADYSKLFRKLDLGRRRMEMLLWARKTLGYQVALHSAQSSALDSDQLGWSLAILARFGENFQSDLAQQDFIKQALKCLFQTQLRVGTWRHYQPLFHYEKAGNAYSYVFETLGILIKAALSEKKEAEFLRTVLRPYCPNLIRLWQYARLTQVPLSPKGLGWSSGHRTNQQDPEAWATASVFAYAQALRRLVGIWTREEALLGLNRIPVHAPPDTAQAVIIERGNTWPTGKMGVAEQLITMFVNPVRMADANNRLEPDSQPIEDKQARSAILFGPPGTSKTTLARNVAGAIGWDCVELHASHFVAEGLPNVQRTADEIFQKLLELDHVVILFDEIDELVRERAMEVDAFGRFLTTSMLPRLAELWRQRKIIYFVCTNHIRYFDRAVTRSERFDALILVNPPSFEPKIAQLKKILDQNYHEGKLKIDFEFSAEQVQEALDSIDCKPRRGEKNQAEDELPNKHVLAKFFLLRWDQLAELALLLMPSAKHNALTISKDLVEQNLCQVADSRLRVKPPYCECKIHRHYERRDYNQLSVWLVEGLALGGSYPRFIKRKGNQYFLVSAQSPDGLRIPGYRLWRDQPGFVKCEQD